MSEVVKMEIRTTKKGTCVEELQYGNKVYIRYWEIGEFEVDDIEKHRNLVGDVFFEFDDGSELLRVSHHQYIEDEDGNIDSVDVESDHFRENYETIRYWIEGGDWKVENSTH